MELTNSSSRLTLKQRQQRQANLRADQRCWKNSRGNENGRFTYIQRTASLLDPEKNECDEEIKFIDDLICESFTASIYETSKKNCEDNPSPPHIQAPK